ncbi:cupin domain-containing protein [Nibribacter ruber]|uniref:Cupin domain-containing protein n=1 Tax=Nibribacter ruber TaxID=2698458 RepID=A0A6P1NXC6_9BACT|nr:cupin domain-containing protein [Nibribacter ruber]QHL86485.1 cupin domain-containing protein [Nibribacter ruber]
MNQPSEILASGLLELYVMGAASPEEMELVESMAAQSPAVRAELTAIETTLETYSQAHAVEPPGNVKPLLLATIAYMERLKAGEEPVTAPTLTPVSTPEDFSVWISRPDMQLPQDSENIHACIISAEPEMITAIAWLKDKSAPETHHDQYERFLVLEGSCTVTANNQEYYLKPGSYFEVPLHAPHTIVVTSQEPCKVIIQRVAA